MSRIIRQLQPETERMMQSEGSQAGGSIMQPYTYDLKILYVQRNV